MEEKSASEALCAINTSVKVIEEDRQDHCFPLKLKTYKRRWLMLGLYIFYSAASTCQWIQYSIVANIVSRYYNVSLSTVDWTAMSFMVFYGILIFPASYIGDRLGLRWTAILGSGLSCAGAWVKIFSVARNKFYISFLGQSLVGIMQTLVLITPGRLSAQWFSPKELSTATSLGVFGCQVGIAMGFLVTPIIVRNHENVDDIGADLSLLFWTIAIITTVAFGLVVIFFQEEPKLPPSETRALQKLNRMKEEQGMLATIKRLSKNSCYILLCNSYGLNIGVLNALSTILNQLFLIHFTNGERDAGRIGLAMIITGMLGSVSFGAILDRTHKFKETTVFVYFFSFCGQILFALATCYELKWMVYLSAIFLGFFMSGYLALGYEICTEYTYPESEAIAAGILNIANNVYGVILVIVLGKLLQSYGDFLVHIVLCAVLFVGFIITIFTKDTQRRQDARRRAKRGSSTINKHDVVNMN